MNMLQAESMSLVCLWHINVDPGSLTTIISLVRHDGSSVTKFWPLNYGVFPGSLPRFHW